MTAETNALESPANAPPPTPKIRSERRGPIRVADPNAEPSACSTLTPPSYEKKNGRVIAAALALVLTAAPVERYVYEFSLLGTPVGFVELEVNGAAYTYKSVQLFNRGGQRDGRVREARFELTGDAVPGSLALVRGDTSGCVRAFDELSGKKGELCVTREEDASQARTQTGSLFGKPFISRLGEDGVAREISFQDGRSVFRRVQRATTLSPPDFTGGGFAVSGEGALSVEPVTEKVAAVKLADWTLDAARALAKEVHAQSLPFCVDTANAYVARANADGVRRAVAVHGLHVDGRAYPHAWVRVFVNGHSLELDPTLQKKVTPQTHLPLVEVVTALANTRAGAVWLSLMTGERRVVRR